MLIDLLKQGMIDKKNLLLENYKKIGLNEKQVIIVLLIMELSKDKQKIITSGELEEYMTLKSEKIDNEIDAMISKGLVDVKTKSIDFTELFVQLINKVENEYSDFQSDSFIKALNKKLNTKLTLENIDYLNTKILSNISKEDILQLSRNEGVNSFDDLKVLIDKTLNKKPKAITKYNWLED